MGTIRLIINNNASVELPWSREAVDALRRFARFDPTLKIWEASVVPCSFAKRFNLDVDCVDGRWWGRNYAYIDKAALPAEALRRVGCYTVERYKRVGCKEYCENRCIGAFGVERCVDRCVERCVKEEWKPVLKVKEEHCLFKDAGDSWQVHRGVVGFLKVKMPPYAQLQPLERDTRLRDYQMLVAQSLWQQLIRIGGGVVQMATGAGKSYMAGYIAKQLIRNGYNVVVTALQLDLVAQLKEFARQFGAEVRAVTIQTLYRRLSGEKLSAEDVEEEDAEVINAYADETPISDRELDELVALLDKGRTAIIMDEAHHVPARTVRYVMSHADIRIGLTATPTRADGRDLEIFAYTGPVVEPRITSSYLIARGFAVPVEIRVVDAPKCKIEEAGDGENGSKAYIAERRSLAECEARNKFIVDLARQAEKPVLIITQLVKHAETLHKLARAAGLKAELATGAVKGSLREEIYDRVRRGITEVLVATTLADEGLDLPPLRTLIIALAGKSKTRALQRIGRLVRPYPGKTMAVAYELRDDAEFSAKHLEERLKMYRTEPQWHIVYG